ncbi:hypothetical protein KY334_03920 [Candidatus Woesearchaeota archaeon]|nr:hypothetical protein [Candidatus Woesearchaeota archaeon]
MVKKEIKKIDVKSFTKVSGLVSMIFGLIASLITAILLMINPALIARLPGQYSFIGVIIRATIEYVIIFSIVGILFGLVTSLVYNFVAKKYSGIKIELS